MNYLIRIFIAIVILCGAYATVYAIENTFEISQVVGAPDVTAPSVPANLLATAVSSSQINLSWNASTDAYGVAGYQVFRDSVFIATSSATTYYIDTGLTPETLYTYNVSAFDNAVNISSLSASSSTTTLAVPVVIPPDNPSGGGSGGGGLIGLQILNLAVVSGLDSASINFETNLYTQAVVSWGQTADYEMGSSASGVFMTNHSTNILGLTPNTTYFFKIELVDVNGRKLVLENQKFTTKGLPDTIAPTNVTNLRAVGDDKVIRLTWNNPKVDFDEVRIVRSEIFYPKDLFDGKVIYEGSAEKFIDTDVVYGKKYYYTLFAKDKFGNYSSGSVAKARLYKIGEPVESDDLYADVSELPGTQVHPLIRALTIFDLEFFQNGKKLSVNGQTVDIEGDRELRISLAYEKLPEILKTIAVTMKDSEDPTKTFSFLLRVNKDKTAYEANIAPLGKSGKFEFGVSILDHKNQGLKKIAGVIVSLMPEFAVQSDISFSTLMYWVRNNVATLLVLLLMLVSVLFGFRFLRALKK